MDELAAHTDSYFLKSKAIVGRFGDRIVNSPLAEGAVLGVCVIFLLRWAVVVFTVLLALQGLSYFVVYLVVGFRAGVILAIFALLAMLPSYLTYRAWHSLR